MHPDYVLDLPLQRYPMHAWQKLDVCAIFSNLIQISNVRGSQDATQPHPKRELSKE